MQCMICPNSWRNVSTSLCERRDGFFADGFVKLVTIVANGAIYVSFVNKALRPPTMPNAAACPYFPSRGCRSSAKYDNISPFGFLTAYNSASRCQSGKPENTDTLQRLALL